MRDPAGKHAERLELLRAHGSLLRAPALRRVAEGDDKAAIAKVLREHGVVWQWGRIVRAWKCLDPAQRLSLASTFSQQAKKRLRRSNTVAETIDPKQLDEEKRGQHQLLMLQNSLGMCSLSKHLTKRIEDKQRAKQQLAEPNLERLAEVLVAF